MLTKTEVFDLLGVVKLVGITGTFAGDQFSDAVTFAASIEALVNGNQTVINFISDQTGTISAMVASVRITWTVPGFVANYDIKLIQGVFA